MSSNMWYEFCWCEWLDVMYCFCCLWTCFVQVLSTVCVAVFNHALRGSCVTYCKCCCLQPCSCRSCQHHMSFTVVMMWLFYSAPRRKEVQVFIKALLYFSGQLHCDPWFWLQRMGKLFTGVYILRCLHLNTIMCFAFYQCRTLVNYISSKWLSDLYYQVDVIEVKDWLTCHSKHL